jgi:hypothetical protein
MVGKEIYSEDLSDVRVSEGYQRVNEIDIKGE